jgi:hypothetical protein
MPIQKTSSPRVKVGPRTTTTSEVPVLISRASAVLAQDSE